MLTRSISRRRFLGVTGLACGAGGLAPAESGEAVASFFVVSDTHYLARTDRPSEIDPSSAEVTSGLIDALNRLPGAPIPESAGGGTVRTPKGVIHCGDCIDTGDKRGPGRDEMQLTEWRAFEADFGLRGDGRLNFPVYELHGNHDGPNGTTLAIAGIMERNRRRPGLANLSDNGLHYSWDWGPAHFVNLGIVVGREDSPERQRRYAPWGSLEFLIADLEKHVAASGRPVVIGHHVDVARYCLACDAAGPAVAGEWDPCDARAFHEALQGYRVAATFCGHTHVRAIGRWDGSTIHAPSGVPIFNADQASHFREQSQAFFYVELSEKEIVVREYATTDRWRTGDWTAACWRVEL